VGCACRRRRQRRGMGSGMRRCGASPCPPAAAPEVAIVHQQLLKLPDALPRHLWLLLVAALLQQAPCRCSDAPKPCIKRPAGEKGATKGRQNLGAASSLQWDGWGRVQA
jgi:hypothetical protein